MLGCKRDLDVFACLFVCETESVEKQERSPAAMHRSADFDIYILFETWDVIENNSVVIFCFTKLRYWISPLYQAIRPEKTRAVHSYSEVQAIVVSNVRPGEWNNRCDIGKNEAQTEMRSHCCTSVNMHACSL